MYFGVFSSASWICFKFCDNVPGWTPTKFGQIGVLLRLFMELWVVLCYFGLVLKK